MEASAETGAPKRSAGLAALRIKQIDLAIVHIHRAAHRQRMIAINQTNHAGGRLLLQPTQPAGIPEHLALLVTPHIFMPPSPYCSLLINGSLGPLAIRLEADKTQFVWIRKSRDRVGLRMTQCPVRFREPVML